MRMTATGKPFDLHGRPGDMDAIYPEVKSADPGAVIVSSPTDRAAVIGTNVDGAIAGRMRASALDVPVEVIPE